MKKVYLLKGLPACGKTTWAKKMIADHPGEYKRVNKDDIRAMLDGGKWSPTNEKFVLQVRDQLITAALDAGKHVIVDDTNLDDKHEKQIGNVIRGKAVLIIVDLRDVPLEECLERDKKRPNGVGERVIKEMYRKYLQNAVERPRAVYNPMLPDAVIVDIDGTLAKMNGRGPFEWQRVGEDEVNDDVVEVLNALQEKGWSTILLSGRDSVCRRETEAWLDEKGISYNQLFMREKDDNRKDALIKKELYENNIKGRYNVMVVLDDRNQVVSMWREQGLTCFQVADGDF